MSLRFESKRLVLLDRSAILTLNTSPENTTVVFEYKGQTLTGLKSIKVKKGNSVKYTVSASGYQTKSATMTVNSNQNISVTLTAMVTLTINTTPSNASVSFVYAGQTYSGSKSITVPKGSSVKYTVSCNKYDTKSATVTVNSTQTVNVSLEFSKTIPASWGNIKSAGISYMETAVGSLTKQKCLTIVTTTGAFAVPFATGNTVPTTAQITSAPFASGTYFTNAFNSGYWPSSGNNSNTGKNYTVGKVYPAILEMVGSRAAWFDITTSGQKLAVRQFQNWGSDIIPSGYAFEINSNILKVKYNNQVVLELK